jgi:hypothetical protein
MTNENISQIIF